MADFSGEYDGLKFHADYGQAAGGLVTWTAMVRNSEGVLGFISGRIHSSNPASEPDDVRSAVDAAIRDCIASKKEVNEWRP